MSLGRRITITVIMTLAVSVLSTVFCAPEAQSEEPLSIKPVKIPATFSLKHSAPKARSVSMVPLPAIGHATTAIITKAAKAKVVQDFQNIHRGSVAASVIAFAQAQIGDPYVWGGTGPTGWDCSGLMVGAFHSVGVNLPRTSRAQFTVGSPVAYGQWAPGDLLFFGSSASSIHHVVLYIGNGQIIQASTFGVPVKVDTVRGGGSDYFGARRVL
jgi:cell wall-associated NlpC family hydrolase